MQENSFGFAHLWESGDAMSHTVAFILLGMSIASWYLILAKFWDWWRLRRAARATAGFWAAQSVSAGLERLREAGVGNPYALLATQAASCNSEIEAASDHLSSRFDPAEQMERALRQQLKNKQDGIEKGLLLFSTNVPKSRFLSFF